jgi:ABC-type cobalamin/Fe3+-siderophores transport system ATPase subunit
VLAELESANPERLGIEPMAEEPDWVLEDVSFVAETGDRLAIVGPTGAGKSTIMNLIMRFYEAQRGRILLDGVDIREIPTRELRSRMGLVLQDVYLFSGSAADNIKLDRLQVTDRKMREAAERVGVDRHIERLPAGYHQELGERGSKLSVGERQLLSFARALAGDPQVLLLDEATSSVDSEIEAQIERALEELMKGPFRTPTAYSSSITAASRNRAPIRSCCGRGGSTRAFTSSSSPLRPPPSRERATRRDHADRYARRTGRRASRSGHLGDRHDARLGRRSEGEGPVVGHRDPLPDLRLPVLVQSGPEAEPRRHQTVQRAPQSGLAL